MVLNVGPSPKLYWHLACLITGPLWPLVLGTITLSHRLWRSSNLRASLMYMMHGFYVSYWPLGKNPIDLGPIKNLGPGLYDWKDDGKFTTWLWEHLEHHQTPRTEVPNVITTIRVEENHISSYPNFVTFFDELGYEAMSNLEVDSTQPHWLKRLMHEEDFLLNSFHFVKPPQTYIREVISLLFLKYLVIGTTVPIND